jgi:hypothetical protein
MSTFKLEVGGNCANGARVVALYCGLYEGVVLADYHGEYVTWIFNTDSQDVTNHGHYFRDTYEDAWDEAREDFLQRVAKYL